MKNDEYWALFKATSNLRRPATPRAERLDGIARNPTTTVYTKPTGRGVSLSLLTYARRYEVRPP